MPQTRSMLQRDLIPTKYKWISKLIFGAALALLATVYAVQAGVVVVMAILNARNGHPINVTSHLSITLILSVIFAGLSVVLFRSALKRERVGCFRRCGYDLRGSKGQPSCPECGEPLSTISVSQVP